MHATCPLRSPKRKRARLLLGTRSKRKQEGNGILISSKNILFLEAQPHPSQESETFFRPVRLLPKSLWLRVSTNCPLAATIQIHMRIDGASGTFRSVKSVSIIIKSVSTPSGTHCQSSSSRSACGPVSPTRSFCTPPWTPRPLVGTVVKASGSCFMLMCALRRGDTAARLREYAARHQPHTTHTTLNPSPKSKVPITTRARMPPAPFPAPRFLPGSPETMAGEEASTALPSPSAGTGVGTALGGSASGGKSSP